MTKYPVFIHTYDLSKGMAKKFSLPLLGKTIDGIWHSAVVVYGREWYWGATLQDDLPKQTPFGIPTEIIDMGETSVSPATFREFKRECSPRFTQNTYHLLDFNCNNWTDEAVFFLTGNHVPSHITGVPSELLNSPLGALIRPLLANMDALMGRGAMNPGADPSSLMNFSTLVPPKQPLYHEGMTLPLVSNLRSASFVNGNVSKIVAKLKFFSSDVSPAIALMGEECAILDRLAVYLDDSSNKQKENVPILSILSLFRRVCESWPAEKLFPCVDLMRLYVLKPDGGMAFADDCSNGPEIIRLLLSRFLVSANADAAPAALQMMVLRLLVNMFSTTAGSDLLLSDAWVEHTLDAAVESMGSPHSDTALASVTLIYNCSQRLNVGNHCIDEGSATENVIRCLSALIAILETLTICETAFRALLSIGLLIMNNREGVEMVKTLEFDPNQWENAAQKRSDPATITPELQQRIRAAVNELQLLLNPRSPAASSSISHAPRI